LVSIGGAVSSVIVILDCCCGARKAAPARHQGPSKQGGGGLRKIFFRALSGIRGDYSVKREGAGRDYLTYLVRGRKLFKLVPLVYHPDPVNTHKTGVKFLRT